MSAAVVTIDRNAASYPAVLAFWRLAQIKPPFDACQPILNMIKPNVQAGNITAQMGAILASECDLLFKGSDTIAQVGLAFDNLIEFAIHSAQVLKDQVVGFSHWGCP